MAPLDRKETPATEKAESFDNSNDNDIVDAKEDDDVTTNTNRHDIARLGNGNDEELSEEQYEMIYQLFDHAEIKELREKLLAKYPDDAWFANDYDTCRRYLVARQWKMDAARKQLASTLEWRRTTREGRDIEDFSKAPLAAANPLALAMRSIGWDKDGRPICYSCFAESHDRWDPHANTLHTELIMEAFSKMLYQRRQKDGLNQTAASRQWIFVIDFEGFGWRDQNPKAGLLVAQVLQHFPETLHLAVLMNTPHLFSGMYKLVQPLLDARVRDKVLFVRGSSASSVFNDKFRKRLGDEAVEWLLNETEDSQTKRDLFAKQKKEAKSNSNTPPPQKRRYWDPPTEPSQHDARGMKGYVDSEFYIKTPGDAYLERQQQEEK